MSPGLGSTRCGLIPVHCKHADEFAVGRGDADDLLGWVAWIRPTTHGGVEHRADVLGHTQHVAPVAAVGNLEPVDVRRRHQGLALGVVENHLLLLLQPADVFLRFGIPLIGQPLEEHQGQDVRFVVLSGGFAPEDVGRTPQMGFKFLLR